MKISAIENQFDDKTKDPQLMNRKQNQYYGLKSKPKPKNNNEFEYVQSRQHPLKINDFEFKRSKQKAKLKKQTVQTVQISTSFTKNQQQKLNEQGKKNRVTSSMGKGQDLNTEKMHKQFRLNRYQGRVDKVQQSFVQSSTSSIISNKMGESKRRMFSSPSKISDTLPQHNRKNSKKAQNYLQNNSFLLKRQSSQGLNQMIDSRKSSKIHPSEKSALQQDKLISQQIPVKHKCNCSGIPLKRMLTFFTIYQIYISQVTLIAIILTKSCLLINCPNSLPNVVIKNYYLLLLSCLILIIPTFYAIKCLKSIQKMNGHIQRLLSQGGNKGDKKCTNNKQWEGNAENSEQFLPVDKKRCSKKIFNSFYDGIDEENTQDNNSINYLQNNSQKFNNNYEEKLRFQQQCSQLESSIINDRQPIVKKSKPLIVVPYMHNNEVQHFSRSNPQKPKQQCGSSIESSIDGNGATLSQWVFTNSKIKYCPTCQQLHFGYDHYCRWLEVCIDLTNYHYFLKFVISLVCIGLLSAILTSVFIFTNSIIIFSHGDFGDKIMLGFLIFVDIQNIGGIAFCGYVLGYHAWLNTMGVTTRQHFIKHNQRLMVPNACVTIMTRTLEKSLCHSITQQFYNNFIWGIVGNTKVLELKDRKQQQTSKDVDYNRHEVVEQTNAWQQQKYEQQNDQEQEYQQRQQEVMHQEEDEVKTDQFEVQNQNEHDTVSKNSKIWANGGLSQSIHMQETYNGNEQCQSNSAEYEINNLQVGSPAKLSYRKTDHP